MSKGKVSVGPHGGSDLWWDVCAWSELGELVSQVLVINVWDLLREVDIAHGHLEEREAHHG